MFTNSFSSLNSSKGGFQIEPTGIPGVDEQDLRKAFREIDLDNDGQISARDLKAFLESIGERPSNAEIDQMIRMADAGKDGLVHLAEFFEIFQARTPQGVRNEIFDRTIEIMSSMQADVRELRVPIEKQLNLFVSSLPGALHSQPVITREYLRDIIFRWKDQRFETLNLDSFLELLKLQPSESSERVFMIFSQNSSRIDIKQLILMLGAFVAAPCDERVDFACRILDDANSGFLSEKDVTVFLNSNFIAVKSDLKARIERIMKTSDGNGLISRREITRLSRYDPGLFFPVNRIDFPLT